MLTHVESHIFVNSSNILRVDFDNLTETMMIYFRNGSIYQYVGVPYKLFEDFKACESAGKFFTSNIKNNFEFMKRTEKL